MLQAQVVMMMQVQQVKAITTTIGVHRQYLDTMFNHDFVTRTLNDYVLYNRFYYGHGQG
jgi:hypothetical protein